MYNVPKNSEYLFLPSRKDFLIEPHPSESPARHPCFFLNTFNWLLKLTFPKGYPSLERPSFVWVSIFSVQLCTVFVWLKLLDLLARVPQRLHVFIHTQCVLPQMKDKLCSAQSGELDFTVTCVLICYYANLNLFLNYNIVHVWESMA